MKTVNRDQITDKDYRLILDTEIHHNHEIIEDDAGTLRWKQNPVINELIKALDLNNLMWLFQELGLNKNSEIIRNLYRNMGYSLFGYWELFYWEVNNDIAKEYKPQIETTTIEGLLIREPDFLLDVQSMLNVRPLQKVFSLASQASAEFSAELLKSANSRECKVDKKLLEKSTNLCIQSFIIQTLFTNDDKKEMVRRKIDANEYY